MKTSHLGQFSEFTKIQKSTALPTPFHLKLNKSQVRDVSGKSHKKQIAILQILQILQYQKYRNIAQ